MGLFTFKTCFGLYSYVPIAIRNLQFTGFYESYDVIEFFQIEICLSTFYFLKSSLFKEKSSDKFS